jgi:hypothetical protein
VDWCETNRCSCFFFVGNIASNYTSYINSMCVIIFGRYQQTVSINTWPLAMTFSSCRISLSGRRVIEVFKDYIISEICTGFHCATLNLVQCEVFPEGYNTRMSERNSCWVVCGNGNLRAVEQRVNLPDPRHIAGPFLASSVADV